MIAEGADVFEAHRPALLSLAYRMLGDIARAEDVVQEAWVRWHKRYHVVDSHKAFLMTTVTRLCMDELGSARARREVSRSDRLPEPADLDVTDIGRVELLDQVSMAFLVLLQRLTAAERAVLVLHDVFDMSHAEIGAMLKKTDEACRQLLKSARQNIATEQRTFETSPDQHRRMTLNFMKAVSGVDTAAIYEMLAEDAVLIVDGGPGVRRFGRVRKIGRPVAGRRRISALVKAFGTQDASARLTYVERTLNGQSAVLVLLDQQALAAMFLAVAEGEVRHIFIQGDPDRLRHIGAPVAD